MDPRGTVGRIYKEEYYALLKALGIVALEKKIFSCFSFCKSIEAICGRSNYSDVRN